MKPVIHVIDDDEAVRDSLRMLLTSVGHEVSVYESGSDFLEQLTTTLSGCILLDIRMPGMSGLELQQVLVEKHCLMPIIFITGHGDVPMAVQAIQRGAFDFLQKPFREQDLLDKIQDALTLAKANQTAEINKLQIQQRIDSLTEREREVMNLVIEGKANKVIAIDLGLSQRTIEIHRSRVMEKMHAKSVAQLVKLALAATG